MLVGRQRMTENEKDLDNGEQSAHDENIEREDKNRDEEEIRKGNEVVKPHLYPETHSKKEKEK